MQSFRQLVEVDDVNVIPVDVEADVHVIPFDEYKQFPDEVMPTNLSSPTSFMVTNPVWLDILDQVVPEFLDSYIPLEVEHNKRP